MAVQSLVAFGSVKGHVKSEGGFIGSTRNGQAVYTAEG
jgi:hypothetical protein